MSNEYTIVKADHGWKVATFVDDGPHGSWIDYYPVIAFKIDHSDKNLSIPITTRGVVGNWADEWVHVTPDGKFWTEYEGTLETEEETLEYFRKYKAMRRLEIVASQ